MELHTSHKHGAARRLRVAYLVYGSGLGGGELLLANHLERRDRARFDPFVVCSAEGALPARLRALHVPVHLLPLDREASVLGRMSLPRPATLWRLVRLLRRERADLLHSYTMETRNYAHAAALITRLPLVHTSQDTWFGGMFGRLQWLALNRIPKRIIVTSEAVRRSLRVGTALRETGVVMINPGIDTARFAPRTDAAQVRAELGIAPDARVAGIIGRLSSIKGYETFFAAAARVARRVPDARFLVVGGAVLPDDDYGQKIHQDVAGFGLAGRVVLTGFRDDVERLIGAMDVLVSASPRESFGMVLAEAGACARPVVAARSGGAEEIVVPGETGMLVPAGNPEAMASAILDVFDHPAAAAAMGEAGRRRVRERFDIGGMVRAVESEYLGILGAQGR
jgi:glycosyltransferase involved in cell wall biosynthesis